MAEEGANVFGFAAEFATVASLEQEEEEEEEEQASKSWHGMAWHGIAWHCIAWHGGKEKKRKET